MRRIQIFQSQSLPRAGRAAGFSLVEVVLALGIVSFSLVGVLSIFPVALDTARDSKNETRITLIAQSIFSDLQSSSPTDADVVYDEVTSPTESQVDSLDLTAPDVLYVAYNGDGLAMKEIQTLAEFTAYHGDAAFLVSIASKTAGVPPGLAQVDVSIQAPPQAAGASTGRKKYYFSAYLPNK